MALQTWLISFAAALLVITELPFQAHALDSFSCGTVLESGVYNTYARRESVPSANFAQLALCEVYAPYTYAQYVTDSASASARSQSERFNVAATAMFKLGLLSFGGGGGSSSGSSSSYMDAQSFSLAKTGIAAYRSIVCGSSIIGSASSGILQVLSRSLEPMVYEAYLRCLQMSEKGLRITASYGIGGNSVDFNLEFLQQGQPAGSRAFLVNVVAYPEGAATCNLYKSSRYTAQRPPPLPPRPQRPPPPPPRPGPPPPPLPPRPSPPPPLPTNPFDTELLPLVYYTVRCAVNLGQTALPGGRDTVEVSVMTTVASSFRTLLYTTPAPTIPTLSLAARVVALEAQLKAQNAKMIQLEANCTSIEGKAAQVEANLTQVLTKRTDVTRLCVGQVCLQPTASGGATDDGNGRLFIVGKNTSTTAAMISSNPNDYNVFALWQNRSSISSPYLFFNSDGGLGVTGGPYPSYSGTFPGTLLMDTICVGDTCLRLPTANRGTLVFGNKNNKNVSAVAIDVGDNPLIFRVFRDRNGLEPCFMYNTSGAYGTSTSSQCRLSG